MTPVAMWVMILICGLVWGGFATLLFRAAKRERHKGEDRPDD